MNKIRKGEVKIYKGKEYIAIPEIEEESCTGCCFYDKGICLIDHANDPNCLHSGMIWEQKENSMSDIKEKAIKLAIEAMRPIPVYSCIHNRVFIPIRPGWIDGNAKIANLIVLSNRLAIFLSYYISYLPLSKYQLASSPDSSLSLPPKKNPIVMPLVINQ